MIEQLLEHISPLNVLVLLLALYILHSIIHRIHEHRKIRALGGYARVRTTYAPLGIDMIYLGVKSTIENTNLQFWRDIFSTWGNPANPYTVEAVVAGRRTILTADPANIKAILATQFTDYGKGQQFNEDWHEFLGDSVFTTDGEKWHHSRQLIRPQFVKDRLHDIKIFERHVQVLLSHLGGRGATVDVLDLFFRYTLDAATDFLLGHSVDSLENSQTQFAQAFAHVQHVQGIITRMGDLNWMLPRKEFHRHIKVINEFINPFIEHALALSPEELEKKTNHDEGYTFLHALASYTRDRNTLRDQIAAILLAGRDTTACTLSWFFYEISNHPRVVQKLRNEILEVVGKESQPTYEHLKSMKYLQHSLNETLRLYPVVPSNIRFALHDTTLPHGGGRDGNSPIGILKDTPIGYSPLTMQRRADLYPPASRGFPPVEAFAPERWDNWTPKTWTYIPFNGGPRICIGQQFALTEMAYTVVRLLQRFERVECRMHEHPGLKNDIVLQPAKETYLAFWAVENDEK